jgi:hypothetical protein
MEEGSHGFSCIQGAAIRFVKLGISISCRVQKPVLKDLDAYRKPLKLSRSAALVKLATNHLAGLKEPAEKLWEGAVEHMFPAGNGAKGDDSK